MFGGLASRTLSEIDEAVLQGVNAAQEAEIRLGLQRGPDTPRYQHEYHRKYDPDGKSRPQSAAKQ